MKAFNVKPLLQSLAIIAVFFISILVYFSPMLDGKQLRQHDVVQYKGMSQEVNSHREKTGEEALWTNSMFGGMPTYLISALYKNIIVKVHALFNTNQEHPQMIAFMYFLCFFIALLMFNIPIWLSMLGALFYGFSSYFFIILEAGHITKAIALGYMPVVIAGVYATYNKKYWLGASLFSLFLAMQLIVNHLQITYYTMLTILLFVGFHAYRIIRSKDFMAGFIKPSLFLLAGVLLAVGANFGSLYMTYDYGKDTMRGKPELTHNAENQTKGLDKTYATEWSYGVDETLNLFIPNFKGGASNGSLDDSSEIYATLKQNRVPNADKIIKNMPLYWGTQSSTSGPVYIGVIVVFLFVFALLIVKGPIMWWLLSAVVFSILLAWGRNFMFLTELFLDYFPGYNKFRTVSMILVIAQFAMPLLAIFGLHKFFTDESNRQEAFKKLKLALYIVGGVLLVLLVTVGELYTFVGEQDAAILPDWLLEPLQNDRRSMMYSDLWRSLFFVVATFGVLTAFYFKKLRYLAAIGILVGLTYMDMWPVNKRYLNNDDFVAKRAATNPFQKSPADVEILQDTDKNFRVMNLTVSPFNDASTSYFHKSIGGYHGAKLQRYQDLIEFHLSKMNMSVYNMLNTKYFIVADKQSNTPMAQRNPDALGNAWFITNISFVANADAEIEALNNFNPQQQAFADIRFKHEISDSIFIVDSTAHIQLTNYAPNHLQYTCSNTHDGVAVFSEIYYNKGWNAYINGERVPHFRVNYVLRAMHIPAGKHNIEFKFEPHMYAVSNRISLASSLLLLLVVIGVLFFEIKKHISVTKE